MVSAPAPIVGRRCTRSIKKNSTYLPTAESISPQPVHELRRPINRWERSHFKAARTYVRGQPHTKTALRQKEDRKEICEQDNSAQPGPRNDGTKTGPRRDQPLNKHQERSE